MGPAIEFFAADPSNPKIWRLSPPFKAGPSLNHLAHLHLADLYPRTDQPGAVAGALAGDFMLGMELASLDKSLRAGIEQHREIDVFTDTHPIFRQSRERLPAALRHWRGVLVDIYYDHFLARHWDRIDSRPLQVFASQIYTALQLTHGDLPPALQRLAPRMIEGNWLMGYAELSDLERLFRGMSNRVKRAHPFADGCAILREHSKALEGDFQAFYPELRSFVAGSTDSHSKGGRREL